MKVIAIIGRKGGVGKSTVAENLFVELTAEGVKVVIIDLDPQGTASRWANRRGSEEGVVSTQPFRLPTELERLRGKGVELVIIDTPAGAGGDSSLEAAKVADLVLAPVSPEVSDIETLPALRDLLFLAKSPPAFVLVNAAPVQGQRHEVALSNAKDMGLDTCPVVLRRRVAFHEAQMCGLGVAEHEPNGAAASEFRHLQRFTRKVLNLQTLEPVRRVHT